MTLPIEPGIWTLDTSATTISFTIKNFGFRTVPGSFTPISGTATIGTDLDGSSIVAEIDAASFDTGNEKRDDHVKTDDFFDVINHPTIRFESTSIKPVGSNFEVAGTLHARQSAPMTFTVTDVRADGDGVRFVAKGQVERAAIGAGKGPNLVIGKQADIVVAGRANPAA